MPGYAGHALHTESHLQNIAAQGAYKGLPGQPTFSDPYAALRLTSQPSSIPSSKPLFGQDSMSQVGALEAGQKAWGLSNFVSQNPNMLAHAADLSSAEYQTSLALSSHQALLNPPPAHSSKTNLLSQRSPFSGAEMFGRTTKSPPAQSLYDPRTQPGTPVSTQSAMFAYSQSQVYHSNKHDVLIDSMNYEAVSPATTPGPDHSNPSSHQSSHLQQSESYLSLQDLASISSTQQKLDVSNAQQIIPKRPSPMVPDRHNKMQHLKNQKSMAQQELYNSSPHMRQSPQQTSVGSPQVPIASPQVSMNSNSSNVQAPPPVQAPADSTTKPKKARCRKKKDIGGDMKADIGQSYSPQPVLNTPDMQRTNSSEYLSNPPVFMPSNRNQQVYSSTSESTNNSPLMNSPINHSLGRGQNHQSSYAKNVPSPNMGHPQTHNPTRPGPQPSPMINTFQSSPTTAHAGMTFSVSDALEMSREAVFANQGLMEGYTGIPEPPYGMHESFTNQLGSMEAMRRPDLYNGAEENVYGQYGGQFVSPNSVLNMDVAPVNNMNQPSTIDEATFSSIMSESSYGRTVSPEKRPAGDKDTPYYSLTVKVEAAQDDDLSHLAKPVSEKMDSKHKSNSLISSYQPHHMSQTHASSQPPPPVAPKPVVQNASGGTSFMDSFLSFIQGKKPETLSSMSSAIIHNKPQLPKYIPEPPRPRKAEPLPPEKSVNTEKVNLAKNCDNVQKTTVVTFSESDDNTDEADSRAVEKAISSLNNENENIQIRTNKLGGLTMKINLNKVKKAEEIARKAAKQRRPSRSRKRSGKEKKFGLIEVSRGADSSVEEETPPARQVSTRKAKDNICEYSLTLPSYYSMHNLPKYNSISVDMY